VPLPCAFSRCKCKNTLLSVLPIVEAFLQPFPSRSPSLLRLVVSRFTAAHHRRPSTILQIHSSIDLVPCRRRQGQDVRVQDEEHRL
jgi:hypothetical protein